MSNMVAKSETIVNLSIFYSVCLGFQLICYGIFLRMFMSLIIPNDFIAGYVILNLLAVISGLILGTILLKIKKNKQLLVIILNFITAVITYLFIFSMPEYTNELDSIEFISWNPFTLMGGPFLMYAYFAIQSISLVIHIVFLGYLQENVTGLSEAEKINVKKKPLILLVVLILIGFLGYLIYQISPKLYLLIGILVLLVENIYLSLITVELNRSKKHDVTNENRTSDNDLPDKSGNESRIPKQFLQKGRFVLVFGYFLMLLPTLLAVVNQQGTGNQVENLIAILPFLLAGYFTGVLITALFKRISPVIALTLRYWITAAAFITCWSILLLFEEFVYLNNLIVQAILCIVLGLSLTSFLEPRWEQLNGKSLFYRFVNGTRVFFFILLFLVANSFDIGFDHNTHELFLYIILGVAVLVIIFGVLHTLIVRKK